jgi:hypothetical protein
MPLVALGFWTNRRCATRDRGLHRGGFVTLGMARSSLIYNTGSDVRLSSPNIQVNPVWSLTSRRPSPSPARSLGADLPGAGGLGDHAPGGDRTQAAVPPAEPVVLVCRRPGRRWRTGAYRPMPPGRAADPADGRCPSSPAGLLPLRPATSTMAARARLPVPPAASHPACPPPWGT